MKRQHLLVFVFISIGFHVAQAKVYGKFMVVKRNVQVLRADGSKISAKVSLSVYPGDTVITGKDSRAKVVMMDRNVVHISPGSRLKIAKYTNNKKEKNVELQLDSGKVRNNVENSYDGEKNKFIIKTPTAVAGVRGTQFITSYNKKTKLTQVVTLRGSVVLRNIGLRGKTKPSVVVVKKGESSTVSENQAPAAPKAIPKQQMQKIDKDSSGSPSGSESAGTVVGGTKKTADKVPDTLESNPGVKAGLNPDNAKKASGYMRPRPKTRNLPADAIRNQNTKSRVIIKPKIGGATDGSGGI